ncbi:hypothetical protein MTO96_010585 [Rhipicephalus appendiculatus]
MRQASAVRHRKWKEQPSQVPSGHDVGSDTVPLAPAFLSHRIVMVVARPLRHACVGLRAGQFRGTSYACS